MKGKNMETKINAHCYPATTLSALSWRNLKRNCVRLEEMHWKERNRITGENEKKEKVEEIIKKRWMEGNKIRMGGKK